VIEKTCRDLQDCVEVYLDGKLVDLPALEGIAVLNIASFGAGMNLWELGVEVRNKKNIQQ